MGGRLVICRARKVPYDSPLLHFWWNDGKEVTEEDNEDGEPGADGSLGKRSPEYLLAVASAAQKMAEALHDVQTWIDDPKAVAMLSWKTVSEQIEDSVYASLTAYQEAAR